MIDERIYTALSTIAPPVYQLVAAQDTVFPFVAFGTETESTQTKDGPGIYTTVLLCYCCATTIAEAVGIGNDVIDAAQLIADVDLCVFKTRSAQPEGEEGKDPIYIETLQFVVKHNIP